MKFYENEKQLAELGMFEKIAVDFTNSQDRKGNIDRIINEVIQRVPNGFVLHTYDENGNTSVFIPVEDRDISSWCKTETYLE